MVTVKYYLLLALLRLIALLPLRVLYIISDSLYFLLYKVIGYRKRVVRGNLRNVFPTASAEQLQRIERQYYHHLADVIVETIKLLHISDREIRRRVTVTNPEVVDAIAAEQRPIVLYLAHYGNWEWMPAMLYSYSPEVHSSHIYRRQRDEASDRLFRKIRSRFPSEGLEIATAVRSILSLSREHKCLMTGFISDHRFNSLQRHQSVMFLNHDTQYYLGGEAIGTKIGARFLYLDVEKTSRGHYRLTFVPVVPAEGDTAPHAITRRYMQLLEATILRDPAPWLWSHKRWGEPEENTASCASRAATAPLPS